MSSNGFSLARAPDSTRSPAQACPPLTCLPASSLTHSLTCSWGQLLFLIKLPLMFSHSHSHSTQCNGSCQPSISRLRPAKFAEKSALRLNSLSLLLLPVPFNRPTCVGWHRERWLPSHIALNKGALLQLLHHSL